MKLSYCILALFFVLNLSAHDFPTLKRDVEKKLEYSDYQVVVKLVNSHEIPCTESQDTDLQILEIDALIISEQKKGTFRTFFSLLPIEFYRFGVNKKYEKNFILCLKQPESTFC